MKNNIRVRNYALMSYLPEETIKKVVETLVLIGRVRHWAYIIHDKDKDEKGELKEKHIHILLQLNNSMSVSAVRSLFPKENEQNTLAQAIVDKVACFNYLNHKDKPDKYQYPDSDIVADDIEYWKGLQKGVEDDKTICIIEDIINGVSKRELLFRYGRDVVINMSKYQIYAQMIREEERENKTPANPTLIMDMETGEVVNEYAPTKHLKIR